MIAISSHSSGVAHVSHFAQRTREGLARKIHRLPDSPRSFNSALIQGVTYTQLLGALDPHGETQGTWQAYTTAMEIGCALFATVSSSQLAVERQIGSSSYSFPTHGPQESGSAGNWLTTLWLTMVCRERDQSAQLAEVSLDSIRRAGLEYDEYIYAWIEALQAYWSGRPGLVAALSRAIDLSYPESSTIAGRELMNHILYHPINLFYKYIRDDHDGFREALEDALRFHKEYWTASEDRSVDPQGFVALGPLAMACLAHDAGFPITVESGYIPEGLVEGIWYGRQ